MIEFDVARPQPVISVSEDLSSGVTHHHLHHHSHHAHHPHHLNAHQRQQTSHPHLFIPHHHNNHLYYSPSQEPPSSASPEVVVSKFGSLFPEGANEPVPPTTPSPGEHLQVLNKLQQSITSRQIKEELLEEYSAPLSPASPGDSSILDPLSLKKKKKSHLSRDELNRVCQGGDVTFEPYNESPYMVAIRCLSDRKSLIGYRCEWQSCGYMNARVERMLGHIRSQHPDAPPVKKLPSQSVTPTNCIRPRSSSSLSTASSLSSGNAPPNLPFMFSPSADHGVGDDRSHTPPSPPLPSIGQHPHHNESVISCPPPSATTEDIDTSSSSSVHRHLIEQQNSLPLSHSNGKLASLLQKNDESFVHLQQQQQQISTSYYGGEVNQNGVVDQTSSVTPAAAATTTTTTLSKTATTSSTDGSVPTPNATIPVNNAGIVDDNNNKQKKQQLQQLNTARASMNGEENSTSKMLLQHDQQLSSSQTFESQQQPPPQQHRPSSALHPSHQSQSSQHHLTSQSHHSHSFASINNSNIQSDSGDYFGYTPNPHLSSRNNDLDFAQSMPAYQLQRSFSQPASAAIAGDFSKPSSIVVPQNRAPFNAHGDVQQQPPSSHQLHSQQHPHQHQNPLLVKSASISEVSSNNNNNNYGSHHSLKSGISASPFALTSTDQDISNSEYSLDLDQILDHDTNSSTGSGGTGGKKYKKIGTGSKNYIGKQNLFQEFLSDDVNKVRDPENRYIIALQKNMKIVGYRCDWPDCEFLTCRKYVMVNHINGKHINQRPFSCPLCSFNFVKRYFLKAHMQKVHKRRISSDGKEDLNSPIKREPIVQADFGYDGPALKRSKSELSPYERAHIDDIPPLQSQYSLDASVPEYAAYNSYAHNGFNGFTQESVPPSGAFPNPSSASTYHENYPTNPAGFDDFLTPPSSIGSSGSANNNAAAAAAAAVAATAAANGSYQPHPPSYLDTPIGNSSTFSFLHTPSSSPALSSLSPAAQSQQQQNSQQPQPSQQYRANHQQYPAPYSNEPYNTQYGLDSKFYPPSQQYRGNEQNPYSAEPSPFAGHYEQNFDNKTYDGAYRSEQSECWNNAGW